MIALDPGPAPTLLDEWVTATAFWWFVLVAATTGVAWFTVWFVKVWRAFAAEEAALEHARQIGHRDVCDLELCDRPATAVYDRHPSGAVLHICDHHTPAVRDWAGPYDQGLDDIEDYANGEKEMPA